MTTEPIDPHEPATPAASPPTYRGQPTPIEGVTDTSATITGTTIDCADPVDLPAGDCVAGLAVVHVPLYQDPGRHHQQSPTDYLAWLVELVDEAERTLERGGRLVLVTKTQESSRPYIDAAAQLLQPLGEAGFTDPDIHTWIPEPTSNDHQLPRTGEDLAGTAGVLPPAPPSSWRVVIASKSHDHRAGTAHRRRKLGLPHRTGTTPDHLKRLAQLERWPIPTATPGRRITQGALPTELVALLLTTLTFVDDVVIAPLTGASTVISETARHLNRRALCFEPDRSLLAHLHHLSKIPTSRGGPT